MVDRLPPLGTINNEIKQQDKNEIRGLRVRTYNKYHTVLYTGVRSDLKKRIWQHQNKEFADAFTTKYNCDKLVYYESFLRIEEAIAREKQIKGGSRKAKEALVNNLNPKWEDLAELVKDW